MLLNRWLQNVRKVYHEYPSQFWVLILGTFIDVLGGALMFPFFTLYVTRRFDVGMTEVGVLFFIFSVTGVIGSFVGGALTDRLGRKRMLIVGLVTSAMTSVLMGLVDTLALFYLVTIVVGVLANSGGPARQAMVADLLPEEKRAQGFGILRVMNNLAVTIGPMIGGLLAAQSYLLLFICDAVASLITATIVYLAIRETRPAMPEDQPQESIAQTFGGYGLVLRDTAFMFFMGASMLMALVYMQMNTSLAVYLRDNHGVSERQFGYILSLNAAMVVLFQFPITRWLSRYRPLVTMAVGALLYAIGFALYGFVSLYGLFLAAMVVITMGEMLVSPVSQGIAARLAPEDKRGRYMAIFGFSWVLPAAVGPLLAGLVMDNLNPNWVWYGAGIIGLISAACFALMEQRVDRSIWKQLRERVNVLQMLENQEISAQEAACLMQALQDGQWASLALAGGSAQGRHLRIRLSDTDSGMMKADLALPLGLVYTALHSGSRLAADLDHLDDDEVREWVAAACADVRSVEREGNERVEFSLE